MEYDYLEGFKSEDFSEYDDLSSVELRYWQIQAKRFFFKHDGNVIFEVVTGAGKTWCAIDIMQEIMEKEPELKVLIVVPKNIILETGWYKELGEAGIPIQKIGVYYGDVKEYAQITITNMQNIGKIPLEIFDMLILDECFLGDTKISIMHHNKSMLNKFGQITETTIKGIVEQKSKGPVVSFNTKTKEFELKKIINWYKIPNKRKLIKLFFENNITIIVTPNQEFYTGEKYITADNINIDDEIIYFGKTPKIIINEDIKQLVLSGILGDGHIQQVRQKARIKFSSIHEEYIILKKSILSIIENNNISCVCNNGYKKQKIYIYNSNIYKDLLNYKNLQLTCILNQLNDFGLAMWFYDDGSFKDNMGEIHTESFSLNENNIICEYLNKQGFDCVVQKTKKKDGRIFYYIRMRKLGTKKAHKIMRSYPLKCFEYKFNFSDEKNIDYFLYTQNNIIDVKSLNNIFINYKRSDKRPSFLKFIKKEIINNEDYVYDIEVEDNHNFIASNMLVHNCHNYGTRRMLELINQPIKYRLGLTATLKRMDNNHFNIMKIFNYNIYKYEPAEALKDGVLNPFIFINVGVELDPETRDKYDYITLQLNTIFKIGGSYDKIMRTTSPLKFKMLALLNERKALVNNYPEKFDIAREIIAHHPTNKIIVFNQFNNQTSKLYWYLLEDHRDCRIVHSGISKDKREQALIDFRNDKYNVLLTSKVLDEGYNLPKLDIAIIMAGDSTDKQTIQRMGRVLRKKKGQNSMLYQIFCINTMEGRNAEKRAAIFKQLASDYRDITYNGKNSLDLH